jgi:hypothetical protein
MSHVAQLSESLEGAVESAGDCLVHAHAANCVLDRTSPLYGDMHPPFDVPRGEYLWDDVLSYIAVLDESGFFTRPNPYGRPVVSLEIRPVAGQDPKDLLSDCRRHMLTMLGGQE